MLQTKVVDSIRTRILYFFLEVNAEKCGRGWNTRDGPRIRCREQWFAWLITKARIHTEYLIFLAFSRQEWYRRTCLNCYVIVLMLVIWLRFIDVSRRGALIWDIQCFVTIFGDVTTVIYFVGSHIDTCTVRGSGITSISFCRGWTACVDCSLLNTFIL
jgi:hypothetical protein